MDMNHEQNILTIYNQAIDIIKREKSIDVEKLIVQLGESNEDISAITLINIIRRLEFDRGNGISMQGSIYPYEKGTKFIYNNIPTLEGFLKENSFKQHIYAKKNDKSEPKYLCPECGGNVRKVLNIVLTSNPPKYRYECDECNYVAFHEV